MDIFIIRKLHDRTLFTYKNLFWSISRKAEIWWTWKINAFYILSSSAKSCIGYTIIIYILLLCIDLSTKPYCGLWFNQTHLLLFKNISVKNYTNYFLSSGGYNFKINYLKDQMRHRMWDHIMLNNSASSPLQQEYYFRHRRLTCYEKAVNSVLRYWRLKFLWDQIIKIISLILWRNMFDVTIVLFFFYF